MLMLTRVSNHGGAHTFVRARPRAST